jgi:hypothetical protein
LPLYTRKCLSPACRCHATPFEVVCRHTEVQAVKCPACAGPTEPDASQFATVAVQREWKRGRGGQERESKALVFQEAGIPEIKRDCPSMDFKVRDGEAVPVFHNDAHHRKVMGELSKAKRRYAEERQAQREAKRKRVNKGKVVKDWIEKASRNPNRVG